MVVGSRGLEGVVVKVGLSTGRGEGGRGDEGDGRKVQRRRWGWQCGPRLLVGFGVLGERVVFVGLRCQPESRRVRWGEGEGA